MGNIQIQEKLFFVLLKYHLVGIKECLPEVEKGLEQKLDSMVMRQLYTQYKTAPTEDEKEKARKEYLDRKGVPGSFRW